MLTTREQRDAEGGRTGGEGRKTKGRKGSRGKGRRMGGERSMVGKKDEVKGLTDLNGVKNKQKPQPNTSEKKCLESLQRFSDQLLEIP